MSNRTMYEFLIVGMVLVTGCASLQPATSMPDTTHQIIKETLKSTDWLMSVLLLGAVLGIFVGLNGLRSGWLAFAACVGGIWLKAALSSTWVFWTCGLLFLASLILALASILMKNTAIRDLIKSCQGLKNLVMDKECVAEIFATTQSKSTKCLVNRTKAELKNKGELINAVSGNKTEHDISDKPAERED